MQVAKFQVTINLVFFHPALDDLVPAPAQIPDEVVHPFAELFGHLFAHGLIAGQAARNLAAVTTGGTPGHFLGLDNCDFQTPFCQFKGGIDAGKSAAHDGNIDPVVAFEFGVITVLIDGSGIVRRTSVLVHVHASGLAI